MGQTHEVQGEPPHPPADDLQAAPRCEIRLKGHLDARWADWFGGLSLTREDDGTTVLRGPVVDQAALHGLLGRVRDLGLPLLSVTHYEPKQGGVRGVPTEKRTPNTRTNKETEMTNAVRTTTAHTNRSAR